MLTSGRRELISIFLAHNGMLVTWQKGGAYNKHGKMSLSWRHCTPKSMLESDRYHPGVSLDSEDDRE
jgi:hypothetical protein